MRLQFETVDVFTSDQFSGNPLAVVLNAEGLSSAADADHRRGIQSGGNHLRAAAEGQRAYRGSADLHAARTKCRLRAIPMSAPPLCWRARAQVMAEPSPATASSSRKRPAWFRSTLLKDGATIVGARLASPQPLTVGEEIPVELVASACGIVGRRHRDQKPPALHRLLRRGFHPCRTEKPRPRSPRQARAPMFSRQEIAKHPATSILIYTQVDERQHRHPRANVRAATRHSRRPRHRQRQCRADRIAGEAAPRAGLAACQRRSLQGVEMGRPSLLHAQAEKRGGIVTATYHRRPLRAGDVGDDRSGVRTLRHCRARPGNPSSSKEFLRRTDGYAGQARV